MSTNVCGQGFRPFLIVLPLLVTVPLFAGGPNSIHGTVKDTLGAVIPGATVQLVRGQQVVVTTHSDAQGTYSFSAPVAGRYQVQASAASFAAGRSRTIYLARSASPQVDVVLSPGVLAEKITVTATGTPTPEARLGSAVALLTSSQFPEALNMQEPLRTIPGLQLTQSGERGSTTTLSIRGGSSDANKVLIDGLPSSFIGGVADFATMPAVGIEQVEVLRGPNSALYGSDALAGVVSMTTARGTTPLPQLSYAADGGNFNTYHQEGTLGGAFRQFDYFSDLAVLNTRNSEPDNSLHNTTYAGNFGWTPDARTTLRLTLRHVQNHVAAPNAIELYGIPDAAGQVDKDSYLGATFENQTMPRWHNLIRYGRTRLHEVYTDYAPTGTPYDAFGTGAPSWYIGASVTLHGANGYTVTGQAIFQYPGIYPSQTLSTANRDFLYAQSDYSFNPHLLALFAFKYENERGESTTTGFGKQSVARGNYSYTMQLAGGWFHRLYYTIGSGIENNAVFGVEATPKASLAYYLIRPGSSGFFRGTKLRGSFGKGIKEPSLYQQLSSLQDLLIESGESALVSQYGIGRVGAERSRSFDAGLDQEFGAGRARAGVTYFHNEFTDGVEYVPQQGLAALGIPPPVAQAVPFGAYVNSLSYRAQGVETEIEYNIGKGFFLRGGYTYLAPLVQRSFSSDALLPSFNPAFPSVPIGVYSPLVGARPFRQAPHSGYFQVLYDRTRWFASLEGTFVSRRDDSDFLYDKNGGTTLLLPNRNLDAAYQRLDWTGGCQLNHLVQAYASLQNLLSQRYAEAFGYPALPFTFRSGIRLTFGGESWRLR